MQLGGNNILDDLSSIHSNSHHGESIPLFRLSKYWCHYLPTVPIPEDIDMDNPLHKLVCLFYLASKKDYFGEFYQLNDIDHHYYECTITYKTLLNKISLQSFNCLKSSSKQATQPQTLQIVGQVLGNFTVQSQRIISSLSLIIHDHLVQKGKKDKRVQLFIKEYPEININKVKANLVENFICFQAMVLKVYQLKLMPVRIDFSCADCKTVFHHYLTDGCYTMPPKCAGRCRSKVFMPLKESIKTIFVQRIKVQEVDSEGRIPRQLQCDLREGLVGQIITGEIVKIAGIIKTETNDEKDKKTQGIYSPYIVVNSLEQKISSNSEHDQEVIHTMKNDPKILHSILKSFCPTIFGHQIVKLGLLLGIIGGSSKNLNDESTFRETSHVLLLGDPGLGKSQLLKFVVQLVPHSIYVNATAISHSGLTVTINKQNSEQSLEAGALILADNAICAIDEFDKATDASSLLEVMEQQTISIAKAGILCQLKCRVGIIASANPISGRYNSSKSFRENTKISNAILSRFDLIFLMVDKPDPERDKKLSEHIMKIHNQKRKNMSMIDQNQEPVRSQSFIPTRQYSEYLSLNDKLMKELEQHQTSYPLDSVRKYIAYVRTQIHPTLSLGALEIIKGFYIALRENNPSNSFQITNRQLESLVRLAMARARLQCRSEVSEQDAIEITQLMQQSLFDSFEEMGYNINSLKQNVKKAHLTKKTGQLSLPKQRTIFVNSLHEQSDARQSNVWEWGELVKLAKELELNIGDFYMFIQRLNQDGILLHKGNKKYAFQRTYL